MTAAVPYSVHAGDVTRDRDKVLGIWRGNLGRAERLEAKYDWFYARCPWGAPVVRLLRHDPTQAWVGAAAIGRRRMLWQGRTLLAGVLVDMAVVPQHRTLGPALLLQRALIEDAMQDFDLVYGFPNGKAVAVVKRVGYVRLTDIVRYSCVLRHAPYLHRHLAKPLAAVAGWALDVRTRARVRRIGAQSQHRRGSAWLDAVEAGLPALWGAARTIDLVAAERDGDLLRWRFDEAPDGATRYLLLSRPDGASTAWFACHFDGRVLHVQDFCADDGPHGGVDVASAAALLRAARALGAISVSVQLAGSAAAAASWRRAGFVERARRPVYGCWNPRFGEVPPAIHLTAADEDE